jgi:hypothetical protein
MKLIEFIKYSNKNFMCDEFKDLKPLNNCKDEFNKNLSYELINVYSEDPYVETHIYYKTKIINLKVFKNNYPFYEVKEKSVPNKIGVVNFDITSTEYSKEYVTKRVKKVTNLIGRKKEIDNNEIINCIK